MSKTKTRIENISPAGRRVAHARQCDAAPPMKQELARLEAQDTDLFKRLVRAYLKRGRDTLEDTQQETRAGGRPARPYKTGAWTWAIISATMDFKKVSANTACQHVTHRGLLGAAIVIRSDGSKRIFAPRSALTLLRDYWAADKRYQQDTSFQKETDTYKEVWMGVFADNVPIGRVCTTIDYSAPDDRRYGVYMAAQDVFLEQRGLCPVTV